MLLFGPSALLPGFERRQEDSNFWARSS